MPAEWCGITWTENVHESFKAITEVMCSRSDGQPVRLKNKVKVDVDGNLDVRW